MPFVCSDRFGRFTILNEIRKVGRLRPIHNSPLSFNSQFNIVTIALLKRRNQLTWHITTNLPYRLPIGIQKCIGVALSASLMPTTTHTLLSPFPYYSHTQRAGLSMPTLCVEYAKSMRTLCLAYAKRRINRFQSLKTSQSSPFKNAINFCVARPRWLMAFFTSWPSSAKVCS